jgi:hypothetical protein
MYRIAQPFTAGAVNEVIWNALKGIIKKKRKLQILPLKG